MRVHIYDYEDWAAVYIDGKLVHWHDTPHCGKMLQLVGIDCERDDLPDAFRQEADRAERGDHWRPPDTLEEFRRRLAEYDDDRLEEEIGATRDRLRELKKRRQQRQEERSR